MKSGWKGERGQALLMTALSLSIIFGILGLTADVGWAYYRQQAAQTAAESAAIAAVKSAQTLSATYTCGTDLECPSDATACSSAPISSTLSPSYNSVQIGCYYAFLDGFSQGGSSGTQSVTMTAGTGTPPTVPNVSTNYWVTVRASESISQLFSAIISGDTSLTASARATAAIVNAPLSGCAYMLGSTGTDTLMVGDTNFVAPGCTVNANSDVDLKGGADMNVSVLNAVGTAADTGGGSYGNTVINTGIATPFSDPLANVPAPTPGTCLASVHATKTVNLTPGTYCGGISGTGGSTINFAPGVYILLGGGLSFNGNASGTGVMFYNTFNSTYSFSPVSITGSGTITLSAPTSGPYQSVLFFEDRNAPSGNADTIEGSSTLTLVGDLYFKNSELDLGGSSSSTDVAIVANSLYLHGGGTFQSTQLSTAAAPSVPTVVLIE